MCRVGLLNTGMNGQIQCLSKINREQIPTWSYLLEQSSVQCQIKHIDVSTLKRTLHQIPLEKQKRKTSVFWYIKQEIYTLVLFVYKY